MTSCRKCGRPIGYDSVQVEVVKSSEEHTYRFDTEACFSLWVRETYIDTQRAVGKMGLSGNTHVHPESIENIFPHRKVRDNPQA